MDFSKQTFSILSINFIHLGLDEDCLKVIYSMVEYFIIERTGFQSN